MNILAADIGGTKTLIKVIDEHSGDTLLEASFHSHDYTRFDILLAEVSAQVNGIHAACFAVAGPIEHYSQGQRANVTNLPWQLDSTQLSQQFDIPKIRLINDFEAIGYAIDELDNSDIVELQAGDDTATPALRALIGAGTGLGQALLFPLNDHYQVHATEGGHADFSPRGEVQIALLQQLQQKLGRVSVEQILSGPGLLNIFTCLAEQHDAADIMDAVTHSPDSAAAISQLAIQQHPLAQQAMKLFVDIYGAQAGNLALNCLPFGGLYIAGGIAAKILPQIQQGAFMQAFLDKSPMMSLLEKIPVRLITNPQVGLIGALAQAKKIS
jgi:glucokinase